MEKLLFGIFAMLHASTHVPEFAASHDETNELAKAWADCAKYYPALNLDPAIAAPVNLVAACSVFVGTRIVSYKMRKTMERGPRPPRQQAQPTNPAPSPQPNPIPAGAVMAEQINGVASPLPPRTPTPTQEMRTGEIAGVGKIEFPPDHPLVRGRAN